MDGLLDSLLRTTVCTGGAAFLAARLLGDERRSWSPAFHRLIWCLVLAQGWAYGSCAVALPFLRSAPITTGTLNADVGHDRAIAVVVGSSPSNGIGISESLERRIPASAWIAIVWLAGAGAVVLVHVRQYRLLLATIPLGQAPASREWAEEWERVARDAGASERTQFRISDQLGPFCCFVPYFYLVVVPKSLWLSLDAWQRESVLHHELAHLVRHDLWKAIFIRLLVLPQWFNPLAWKAVRAFDNAAEWACDDFVVGRFGRLHSPAYAATLLRIAEQPWAAIPSSMSAQGGHLSTRIKRLLQPRFKEETTMKKTLMISVLGTLFAFQSLRLVALESPEPDSPKRDQASEADARDDNSKTAHWAESHDAALARTGLRPYRVFPPDLLQLTIISDDGETSSEEMVVEPDGTLSISPLGSLNVAGKTLDGIHDLITARLKDAGSQKRVIVDLKSSNSKYYYVVQLRASGGDQVWRFPCTGKEMVVDALSQIDGLGKSSLEQMWIVRPNAQPSSSEVVLRVDWEAIKRGKSLTNFHLYPGDRLFVAERDPESQNRSSDAVGSISAPASLSYQSVRAERLVAVECELIEIAADRPLSLHALLPGDVADEAAVSCVLRSAALDAFKDELSSHGTLKTIGVPKVITTSGDVASVHIGSELEIPVPQNNGDQWTLERKPLGMMVDVTPTMLEADRIRLECNLSWRQIHEATSVMVGGRRVPGLRTAWVSRTADLAADERLVILMACVGSTDDAPKHYVLAVVRAPADA